MLTAAERTEPMPCAQIAIRIGGAIVVTRTLLARRALGMSPDGFVPRAGDYRGGRRICDLIPACEPRRASL
jgi:hypothetical protein